MKLSDIQSKKVPKDVVVTFRTTKENKKFIEDNYIDYHEVINMLRKEIR